MRHAFALLTLAGLAGCAAPHRQELPDAFTTPTTQAGPATREWKSRDVVVGDLDYLMIFPPRTVNRLNQDNVALSYSRARYGEDHYIIVEFQVANHGPTPVTVPPPKLTDANGATYEQASETLLANDVVTGLGRLNPHEVKNAAAAFAVGYSPDPSKYSIVFGSPGAQPEALSLK